MNDWNRYRYQTHEGGPIDLYRVTEENGGIPGEFEQVAHGHFKVIEELRPIYSRQAAAVSIGTWSTMAGLMVEMKRMQAEIDELRAKVEKMQAQPAVAS